MDGAEAPKFDRQIHGRGKQNESSIHLSPSNLDKRGEGMKEWTSNKISFFHLFNFILAISSKRGNWIDSRNNHQKFRDKKYLHWSFLFDSLSFLRSNFILSLLLIVELFQIRGAKGIKRRSNWKKNQSQLSKNMWTSRNESIYE